MEFYELLTPCIELNRAACEEILEVALAPLHRPGAKGTIQMTYVSLKIKSH
jgi:hypothetical protein